MKKKFSAVLLSASVLVGCQSAKDSSQVSEKSISTYVEAYQAKVDEKNAYEIAYTLAYDEAYLSNELGFRTSGSDAEHAAADYLADKMKEIGLEVEKVPVTVDKWQFNDASLTIEGTDIEIMPASYASNGTSDEGLKAQIVDAGDGTEAAYDGLDVEGKIVVAGVDQWNVAWIDQYMNEAANHGAAAILTYDNGGYATYDDDMLNMQDLCGDDVIPCASISKNQYKQIAEAIENGNDQAVLKIDNEMLSDEGVSYNVVGKLAGKNHDQQIIVSGHYDVYFNGFQDDSCAVGLVLAMAKGMQDSGYQPENDILFIAHAAEEWGAISSQFDWTTGAWEMINNAHPEWAEKTIAMINFELPAFYDNMDEGQISCVPEFANLTADFVKESGYLPKPVNDVYKNGISEVSVDTNTMEDGVSYRASGVPYFINIPGTQDGEEGWIQQRYHTVRDDADTYNADVMQTNLNTFGTLAIYLDQMPALSLDFTSTCEDLMEAAELDDKEYTEAVEAFKTQAEKLNSKIRDINERYVQALSTNASAEELEAIREEGRKVNKISLHVFKQIQEGLIGIAGTSTIQFKHVAYQTNCDLLDVIIDDLKIGDLGNEEGTGALDLAWMLNGSTEFGYYNFSVETNAASKRTLLEEQNQNNVFWGTGKGSIHANTYEATRSLLVKAEAGETDFSEEISIYSSAREEQKQLLEQCIASEIEAIQSMTDYLSNN